jgi:hypothetical protein
MDIITSTDEVATAADVTTSTTGVIEKQPDSKYIFDGAVISPEVVSQVITKINEAKALLPNMPNLTSLERRRHAKLGTKSLGFVHGAFEAAKKDPGVLPGSLSVQSIKQQEDLYEALSLLEAHASDFNAKLGDALLMTGSFSYSVALSIYQMFKTPIAKAKMPEQQAFLRQRFARVAKKKADQPEVTAKN